ncbi:hypothetical protein [Methylobacterium komagatae]
MTRSALVILAALVCAAPARAAEDALSWPIQTLSDDYREVRLGTLEQLTRKFLQVGGQTCLYETKRDKGDAVAHYEVNCFSRGVGDDYTFILMPDENERLHNKYLAIQYFKKNDELMPPKERDAMFRKLGRILPPTRPERP